MTDTPDGYLDLAILTAYSSLGKTTLREHIQLKEVCPPAYCPEDKILVRKSDFDTFIRKHRVMPGAEVNQIVENVMAQLRSR